MRQRIVLHIGLPKTGTTSMQLALFPRYPGFLERPNTPADNERSSLLSLYHTPLSQRMGALRSWCQQVVQQDHLVIVSNEALSRWSPWASEPVQAAQMNRKGPHPIIPFLRQMQSVLGACATLQVIITFRNQSDYCASLYAQLFGRSKVQGQPDFEARMREILRLRDAGLDWNSFRRELVETVGNSNLLVLFFEHGFSANASAIEGFLGAAPTEESLSEPRLNQKSLEPGVWEMKGTRRQFGDLPVSRAVAGLLKGRDNRIVRGFRNILKRLDRPIPTAVHPKLPGTRIYIPDNLRRHMEALYAESNWLLGQAANSPLSDLGYGPRGQH